MKKKYTNYAVKQTEILCKIPSPSGFTKQATDYSIKELKTMGFSPTQTRKNSVLAKLGGKGKPVVLAAHVDTLGAMVRAIKSNGRLRFTKIGGYPENNIEAENCIIHTREGKTYSGTIQLNNPAAHVNAELGKEKRSDTTMEVVIDEKTSSSKETEKLGISAGDFISLDSRTVVTKSGFIKSRHLDDKASAGILLSFAKAVSDKEITLNRKVYLLFTTYEEVGHGGSGGIPQDAQEMISVDMGAVGDDLKTDEHKVSICAKDSGGPYDYDVTTKLINLAKRNLK
jgi:putative aminopeptidase FrvX